MTKFSRTFKRRRGPKGKGSRKSKRSRRPRQSGGFVHERGGPDWVSN